MRATLFVRATADFYDMKNEGDEKLLPKATAEEMKQHFLCISAFLLVNAQTMSMAAVCV